MGVDLSLHPRALFEFVKAGVWVSSLQAIGKDLIVYVVD